MYWRKRNKWWSGQGWQQEGGVALNLSGPPGQRFISAGEEAAERDLRAAARDAALGV